MPRDRRGMKRIDLKGTGRGVLGAIGGTPLIELERLFPDGGLRIFAKLEALNPGGSIKDRPAVAIVEEALRCGLIRPDTVVVESSSGNMGIGLAQACRYHGLRFVCVVDTKVAPHNLRVLEAYGAEIERVTEPDPATGEFLQARLARVQALLRQWPHSFWPNQYANENNPGSHYRTTMAEVAEQLDGDVQYLFAATSTCGTIRGCAEYVRDHGLPTRVVAVDAVGSLIFRDQKADRMIPGLGAGLRPPLCDLSLIDEIVHVSDMDCVVGCRQLLQREAILSGGSSGGVIAALGYVRDRIAPGSICVVVLCDRGERYLDTIYDDSWVDLHCVGRDALIVDEGARGRWAKTS
jgi:2,3-diaminopropionate biosynthesis protein SbnA